MRILIACEYSGVVREAFRAKGHDVWSCDLLPAEDNSPYHIQGDVLDLLSRDTQGGNEYDLLIAHPPCTYLCNSGWHWTTRDGTGERLAKAHDALRFFETLHGLDIPKICIENPVPGPLLRKAFGRPDQYIQPYYYGDDASKRTGLWLKGLPKLSIPSEEEWIQPRTVERDGKTYRRWSNQTDSGQNRLPPSQTRGHERSRTYEGIARAFADQWG